MSITGAFGKPLGVLEGEGDRVDVRDRVWVRLSVIDDDCDALFVIVADCVSV